MMKRKFLAVVLPIIGCATVVGSGFSAWYFGQDVAFGTNGNTSIGINITNEVKASEANLSIDPSATTIDDGETKGDEKGCLVLDQGGAGNKSEDSGIMFGSSTSTVTTKTTNEVWGFKIHYDGTSGDTVEPGLSIKELYDAGLRIRVEMTVTLDTTLYKYIGFQGKLPEFDVESENLGTNNTKATFDPKVVVDTSGSAVITANYIVDVTKLADKGAGASMDLIFTLNLDTEEKPVEGRIDYSNKLFVYQENNNDSDDDPYTGGKPHYSDDLETMRDKITKAGSKIGFKVVGHIEDDTTK